MIIEVQGKYFNPDQITQIRAYQVHAAGADTPFEVGAEIIFTNDNYCRLQFPGMDAEELAAHVNFEIVILNRLIKSAIENSGQKL